MREGRKACGHLLNHLQIKSCAFGFSCEDWNLQRFPAIIALEENAVTLLAQPVAGQDLFHSF
jgi:hypothetical protein